MEIKKRKKEEKIRLNIKESSPDAKKFFDFLKSEIKGQDRALEYIFDAYEIYRSGLRNPDKPIFIGLFLGPSGVGKTLVTEVLAKYFFNNPQGFTKILCGELQHSHEGSWLTGAPPGYIGYTTNPKELKLSQFNIDKFDLLYKISTGQLDSPIKELIKDQFSIIQERKQELTRELDDLNRELSVLKQESSRDDGLIRDYEANIRDVEKQIGGLNEIEKANKIIIKSPLKNLNFSNEELFDVYTAYKRKKQQQKQDFLSIILFDEIEKAHPNVYNQLLEIMDKGQFEVGGQIVSFRNSIILMTSNIGSKEIAALIGQKKAFGFGAVIKTKTIEEADDEIYQLAIQKAKEYFPPEFQGRIDKVVVFRPLQRKAMEEIFELELKKIYKNLASKLPIIIKFTKRAKERIIDRALAHLQLGARMISKRLDRLTNKNLARLFNRGAIVAGDIIRIDFKKEEFVFWKIKISKDKLMV